MVDLYRRFEGYDELKSVLSASDEDVLVTLGRPTLIRIPALSDASPASRLRGRFIACLLHGNEDSGYRAVLELLRAGERYPFDLWVFIGNVRAASQEGWFAHRYLDGQEDFNRVWGLGPPTTRMRRCADAVLAELAVADLEAAIDLHNNTGSNPPHAITPEPSPEGTALAALCADSVLHWNQRVHTLMEALMDRCPAVAVECGSPGRDENVTFASTVVRRFLTVESFAVGDGPPRLPERVFDLLYRIDVRPEVRFAVGGAMTEELDLVLAPGLDGYNFGMLLAGTRLGQVPPGAAMPLCATDMDGHDVTERFFAVRDDGRLVVTEDLTPVMMTTTVLQTRRDCLFYIARRRA